MLDVEPGRFIGLLDGAEFRGVRRVEEALDLLLRRVGELVPARIEEFDTVVLGRVVRGGNDDAEIETRECDRRRRQHAAEDRGRAARDDAANEGVFELGPRASCIAPDEDAAGGGPERRRAAETLDQLRCQGVADDAANPVGSEVGSHQGVACRRRSSA